MQRSTLLNSNIFIFMLAANLAEAYCFRRDLKNLASLKDISYVSYFL